MPRTVLALSFALLLAGCAAPASKLVAPSGGETGAAPLAGEDAVSHPASLHVGDWFDLHIQIRIQGSSQEARYKVIVVDETPTHWRTATDDLPTAKEDAVFDNPAVGNISKADLSLTGLGGTWDLYDFPLQDGKTWQRHLVLMSGLVGDVEDDYSFAAKKTQIETPRGPRPGYEVTASRTSDGERALTYDYVPSLGWFAHFYFYDLSTPEPQDWVWHAMVMDQGPGYQGTFWKIEAAPVLAHMNLVYVDPANPGIDGVQPAPYATFRVHEGTASVYGLVFSFAFGGVHELVVVNPKNDVQPFTAVGAPSGGVGETYDVAAVPGEWTLLAAGAGVAAGGGAFLWELHEKRAHLS